MQQYQNMPAIPEDSAPMSRRELMAFDSAVKITCATIPNLQSGLSVSAAFETIYEATKKALGVTSSKPGEAAIEPAVPVKKSVTPDTVFCLECGKPHKSLKRHLRTAHDLTPAKYRARWNLPDTYPMAAPNYSARRSELAKSFGLGKKS